MISVRRVWRAWRAWLCAPLCRPCTVYEIDCIGKCGKTTQERRRCFIAQGTVSKRKDASK